MNRMAARARPPRPAKEPTPDPFSQVLTSKAADLAVQVEALKLQKSQLEERVRELEAHVKRAEGETKRTALLLDAAQAQAKAVHDGSLPRIAAALETLVARGRSRSRA